MGVYACQAVSSGSVYEGQAAQHGVGVDVALFVCRGVQMTGDAFVEFGGLLKAGHAAHPPCC